MNEKGGGVVENSNKKKNTNNGYEYSRFAITLMFNGNVDGLLIFCSVFDVVRSHGPMTDYREPSVMLDVLDHTV